MFLATIAHYISSLSSVKCEGEERGGLVQGQDLLGRMPGAAGRWDLPGPWSLNADAKGRQKTRFLDIVGGMNHLGTFEPSHVC